MIIERTKNTIRNTIWGFINRFVTILFPFIIRTIIIHILGSEYVGLHSLFVSIISMLSLAELGFNTAIVYSMYQPIANGDNETIRALLKFYKNVYRVIGIVVLTIGILLVFFLKYFIHGEIPNDVNIYYLYGIYLFNTVISYWLFAYKNSILIALQRNDISTNITTLCNITMYLLQIILLLGTRNYYMYVICIPICTICINILTARYTTKHFPQYYCKGELPKKNIDQIKKQVAGVFSMRLALTSRNAFDSMIISAFFGLAIVGIYNNYFYIVNAISVFLSIIFSSMQAGIGNSIASESVVKNREDMHRINSLYMIISGWCSISFFLLVQPFMIIWAGRDQLLPFGFVVLLSVYFYAQKIPDTLNAYLSATGLWWKCKYFYLLEALTNLILNIVLGKTIGLAGIIIATLLSVVFINYLSTLRVLSKNYFGAEELKKHILKDVKYFVVTIIIALLSYIFCSLFNFDGSTLRILMTIFFRIGCCIIIVPGLYFLFLARDKDVKKSFEWVKPKFVKYLKKT